MSQTKIETEICIIGGGFAGLVATYELLQAGHKVLLVDRDTEENLGGLAKESFGGVMMVDTPHQRKLKIKDSPELAWRDWLSYAQFDHSAHWPRQWARFYTHNSLDYIYSWLDNKKIKFLPVVNWTERGMYIPGNSVPRWHITWGTGRRIIEQTLKALYNLPQAQNLRLMTEHYVTHLVKQNGRISGCAGVAEGTADHRQFEIQAEVVIIAAGGISGGDLSQLQEHWNPDWPAMPESILNGAHKYGDATLHYAAAKQGAALCHMDKQWHYAAGVHHPRPRKHRHGLSLVPSRSALWLDKFGKRIGPPPLVGYTDTKHLVQTILALPGQHSWQVLNWKIAIKELAVSGAEYMHAFRDMKKAKLFKQLLWGNKELISQLLRENQDFVQASSLKELTEKMNALNDNNELSYTHLAQAVASYDEQIDRGPAFFNDEQLRRLSNFRAYKGDRLRLKKNQKIDDAKARPLIAIREFILARKSLGGLQTDLHSRVLDNRGQALPGLYAVGEAAGFGGGGIHGHRSLEGTFLGSCILTARLAAQHLTGKK